MNNKKFDLDDQLQPQHLEEFVASAIARDLIRLDLGSVEQGKTFNFLGRNVYILSQNLLLISNSGGSK